MYCTKCGNELDDAAVICPKCGVPTANYWATQQPDPAQSGVQQTVQVNVTAPAASNVSTKSRTVALGLCIFLGGLGVHRFYMGRVGLGLLYLFTVGLGGIGVLIDLILVATGSARDGRGCYVTEW